MDSPWYRGDSGRRGASNDSLKDNPYVQESPPRARATAGHSYDDSRNPYANDTQRSHPEDLPYERFSGSFHQQPPPPNPHRGSNIYQRVINADSRPMSSGYHQPDEQM
ncbi:uncharacterized protein LOC101853829 [Aplysia californica]|uniref:Uncharacterized protein LOC101853829 n=1 Tax=Aplysia californica TaxID=6500 RepID=A0ABM0K8U4_APLCA|nr:uncharacterized protein LOC101853829 [Aplysia californica]